jgi:nitric oxide reductase subunit B
MSTSSLKWAAIISFVVSLVVLIGGGRFAKKDLPPYPGKIVASDGKLLFQKSDILAGQDVYQRYGLMDHGSVWGHGSQRGAEFSATSLHLLSETVRDLLAIEEYGKPYEGLDDLPKGFIDLKRIKELRTNRYDSSNDTLTLTTAQTKALEVVHQHWEKILRKASAGMDSFPTPFPPTMNVSRFLAFSSGQPGWLQPTGLEKLTATPTIGLRTEASATCLPQGSTSEALGVFWVC